MHKIIFLFCCLFFYFSQANAHENQEMPKILFQVKSKSLDSLLYQLEQQSGYRFIHINKYKPGETMYFTLSGRKKFEKEAKTVSEILDIFLAKRGYGHYILGECKTIVIYKKEEEIPKITIRFENQSLDSALNQLECQGECRFFYQDKIVKPANINMAFENQTISEILDTLLLDTDYDYFSFGKGKSAVFYKQKSKQLSITGTVVDETGETLYGVLIYIKDEIETKTITNKDGSFTISTTNPNAYLVVTWLGYIPRVVHIKDAELIKLEPDPENLSEVVRIGGV